MLYLNILLLKLLPQLIKKNLLIKIVKLFEKIFKGTIRNKNESKCIFNRVSYYFLLMFLFYL